MKGLCYIVLIIGFFLFYQQNPVYAVVIIALFVGVFIFFKSRKSSSSSGIFRFLSGKQSEQDNRMNDLITFMMIQQLFSSDNASKTPSHNEHEQNQKESYIDKTKREIQSLLNDD
ncbi:MAG: hypothetical protein ACFE9I_01330 [Candidatus Hermodarchaeota archaeon]